MRKKVISRISKVRVSVHTSKKEQKCDKNIQVLSTFIAKQTIIHVGLHIRIEGYVVTTTNPIELSTVKKQDNSTTDKSLR